LEGSAKTTPFWQSTFTRSRPRLLPNQKYLQGHAQPRLLHSRKAAAKASCLTAAYTPAENQPEAKDQSNVGKKQ
jgi:hypothetical protein